MECNVSCDCTQAGAEVDTIATELVPQLQKHTEQLTNVYALIDKMHEHLGLVKESVRACFAPSLCLICMIVGFVCLCRRA